MLWLTRFLYLKQLASEKLKARIGQFKAELLFFSPRQGIDGGFFV